MGEHGVYCLKQILDLPSNKKSTKRNALQRGCSEEGCAVALNRLIGIPEAPRERVRIVQFENCSCWASRRYKPHIAFFALTQATSSHDLASSYPLQHENMKKNIAVCFCIRKWSAAKEI